MTPFYNPATRTFHLLSGQVFLTILAIPALWAMLVLALGME